MVIIENEDSTESQAIHIGAKNGIHHDYTGGNSVSAFSEGHVGVELPDINVRGTDYHIIKPVVIGVPAAVQVQTVLLIDAGAT